MHGSTCWASTLAANEKSGNTVGIHTRVWPKCKLFQQKEETVYRWDGIGKGEMTGSFFLSWKGLALKYLDFAAAKMGAA